MLIRWGLLSALALSCAATALPPEDVAVLAPLVGSSRRDDRGEAHRLRFLRSGDDFRLEFQHVVRRTTLRGRLEPVLGDELHRLADRLDLVPWSPEELYLRNPASRYYWVVGQTEFLDSDVVNGAVVRRPMRADRVVLEVTPLFGSHDVHLHLLRTPHHEVVKLGMVYESLHRLPERRRAETHGCALDLAFDESP